MKYKTTTERFPTTQFEDDQSEAIQPGDPAVEPDEGPGRGR